jgi:AcrR family transcriptional regulator
MFDIDQTAISPRNANEPPPSRQSMRAERTREALLAAAQKIFARDGFEAARIEEIAVEAGRTRGAFYANFESKTEVFLALRNDLVRRRAREVKDRIEHLAPGETCADAVRRHVMEILSEPEAMILQIEFKLFALRHPEMLPRLAEMHLDASTSINLEELPELFPEESRAAAELRRDTLAVESILEGFALNMLFSPALLDRSYLGELVPSFFAQILSGKI